MFESFGNGKQEFLFVRLADELDTDGESFGRLAEGEREARESGQVEPLAEAHGVAIVVRIAGPVVALAVAERGLCGYRREKEAEVFELPEQIGAEEIALHAGIE